MAKRKRKKKTTKPKEFIRLYTTHDVREMLTLATEVEIGRVGRRKWTMVDMLDMLLTGYLSKYAPAEYEELRDKLATRKR